MSYDFYIEKVCNHKIVDEIAQIDPETRTFFAFAKPPSANTVTIKIDGELVPPQGLYTKAEVIFNKSEPYRITANKNDLILFKYGNSPVQTIKLPPGNAVSAKTLARFLLDYAPDLDWKVENHRVVVSSPTPTRGILFSFPDPTWTDKTSSLISTSRILGAYKTLGISPGRAGNGRKIMPGYIIDLNPAAFVEEYIVTFEYTIKNYAPVILVSYQTQAKYCNRCFGSRKENDYTISLGSYETVRDTDLLKQELNKYIFTIKGSHWKWPWMGSTLLQRIGSKASVTNGLTSSFISLDVTNAFNTYQNIKRQQDVNFPSQNVTDAEYPYSLASFNVATYDDPTVYYGVFNIMSRSRQPITLTKQLNVPDPVQLTSDPTGLMTNAGRGFQLVG